jgi:Calcineurin-like phosphoesterase
MSRVTSPALLLLITAAAAVTLVYGLQTTSSSRQHSVPAAKVRGGSWSPPALERRARKALVWAVGDGPDGRAAAKAVAARIARSKVALLLYLGDVYENGTAGEFTHRYAPLYGRFARVTAPTPGNHDWPQHTHGYDRYWRKAVGKTVPSYYSFRIAGWDILSLNSEVDHGTDSDQYRWLQRQLGGRTTCRLAFWHRPRFSAARVHGDAPDMDPLWSALAKHAALVVNGHEHDMQRLHPRDGLVEVVSGAGGHRLYSADRAYRGLAFADDTHYGALRIRLKRGEARLAFVAADGSILDSSTVRCRP